MPVIPAYTGPAIFEWTDGRTIAFHPLHDAPLRIVGRAGSGSRARSSIRINARQWADPSTDHVAGRLFVGLKVGTRRAWTVDDVEDEVTTARTAQGRLPDASYILQRGVFTSGGRRGGLVREPSVQVVIKAPDSASIERFMDELAGLGEVIATRLRQEEAWVEVQVNGIIQRYGRMTPVEDATDVGYRTEPAWPAWLRNKWPWR